jgi:hypothetical protein
VPGPNVYTIVDPRQALGGAPGYAPRVPFTDPSAYWTVEAKAGARVRQFANPDAREVAEPFVAGEEFKAKAIIVGDDGGLWWLGEHDGRIRVSDTVSPKVRIG